MLPTFVLAAVAAIMLMVLADSRAGPGAAVVRVAQTIVFTGVMTLLATVAQLSPSSSDPRSPGKKAQGDKKIVQASIFAGNIFAAPRLLFKCAE
jgi:hypothetical protein